MGQATDREWRHQGPLHLHTNKSTQAETKHQKMTRYGKSHREGERRVKKLYGGTNDVRRSSREDKRRRYKNSIDEVVHQHVIGCCHHSIGYSQHCCLRVISRVQADFLPNIPYLRNIALSSGILRGGGIYHLMGEYYSLHS